VFNIFDFGAKGDGVTDDTVSIQNALNAVPSGGGVVLFPASSPFMVSASLNPKSNTTILAYGASIQAFGTGTGYALLSLSGIETITNFEVLGLSFDLSSKNGVSAVNFNGPSNADIRFVDCTFKNSAALLSSLVSIGKVNDSSFTAGHSPRVFFDRCAFTNNALNTYEALLLVSCDDSAVSECVFSGCTTTSNGVLSAYGYCNKVNFVGCSFNANSSAMYVVSGQNLTCSGCSFVGTANHVEIVVINAKNTVVEGCSFVGGTNATAFQQYDLTPNFDGHPVQFANTLNMLVTGNTLDGYSVLLVSPAHTGAGYNTTPSDVVFQGNVVSNVGATPFNIGTGVIRPVVRNNVGYNPVGKLASQPAVPASGTSLQNTSSVDWSVAITPGTSTCAIAIGGNASGIVLAASGVGAMIRIPAGQTITLTYTNAPTWVIYGD
jgi:hypothetical protein